MIHTSHSPESQREIREALDELVREARRNGVTVNGGWVVTGGPDGAAWNVEITEVVRESSR